MVAPTELAPLPENAGGERHEGPASVTCTRLHHVVHGALESRKQQRGERKAHRTVRSVNRNAGPVIRGIETA